MKSRLRSVGITGITCPETCAIVHQPRLIIMDEPTVGIDPQSRKHILNSVLELHNRGAIYL